MSTTRPLAIDRSLEYLLKALPSAAPGAFPPLTLVFGRQANWGIGIRSDTTMPFAGNVKLLHWIVSPYRGVPDGIVEDCNACRLIAIWGALDASLSFKATDRLRPLPADRADRRNLLVAERLMGLRGWDILHDRHMAVSDLRLGTADTSGMDLPNLWHASWILEARVCRQELVVAAEAGKSHVQACTSGHISASSDSTLPLT